MNYEVKQFLEEIFAYVYLIFMLILVSVIVYDVHKTEIHSAHLDEALNKSCAK